MDVSRGQIRGSAARHGGHIHASLCGKQYARSIVGNRSRGGADARVDKWMDMGASMGGCPESLAGKLAGWMDEWRMVGGWMGLWEPTV